MTPTRHSVDQLKGSIGRGGIVRVYPPLVQDGVGFPEAPNGTRISTSGTTTSGIQEAINYCYLHGYDLHIEGGNDPIPVPGTPGPTAGGIVYQSTTTVNFKPMQGMLVTSGGCTINSVPTTPTDPGMSFDTALITNVRLYGMQLVYWGTGPALRFKPTNPCQNDLAFNIGMELDFEMFAVVNAHTPTSDVNTVPLIQFDCTLGPIYYSKFNITEPLGSGRLLQVIDPPSGSVFFDNEVILRFAHDQTGGANTLVDIGQTLAGGARISANKWDIFCNSANTGKGFATYERSSRQMLISMVSGTQSYAVYFETGAAGNTCQVGQVPGGNLTANGFSIGGDPQKNQIVGMGLSGPVEFSITPPTSGVPWQNPTFQELTVITSGGTVTDILVGALAANVATTGLINGCITIKAGMWVQWNYAVAPTITGIV